MAEKKNPGALMRSATGAGNAFHANAAGIFTISTLSLRCNLLAHRLASFTASFDAATLTELGLAATRIAGMLTWGASYGRTLP